jgi:hypothetical protein
MRIDELQLIAFGPFTDTVLDLSAGRKDFTSFTALMKQAKVRRCEQYVIYFTGYRPDQRTTFYTRIRKCESVQSFENR